MRTSRTWPEGTQPTAQQLADWLLACSPDERLTCAEAFLATSDRAQQCFIRDHDGLEDELHAVRTRLLRYRMAWLSARRRGWWLIERHMSAMEDD